MFFVPSPIATRFDRISRVSQDISIVSIHRTVREKKNHRGGRGECVLELAVLGLLDEQALHGYELRKRLKDLMGTAGEVSFGSLYPALARLEKAGHVKCLDPVEATSPIPATGSLSGERAAFRMKQHVTSQKRTRRVYSVTAEGAKRLQAELMDVEAAEDDKAFVLRVALAHHLDPDHRRELLGRRKAVLQKRLAGSRDPASSRPTAWRGAWERAVANRYIAVVEAELAWLARLDDTGGDVGSPLATGSDSPPSPGPNEEVTHAAR